MTYIPSGNTDNLALNFESITLLYNTANDISSSAGTILPLGSQRSLYGSDTYSVSNGTITLPSGYCYLVRGGIGAYGTTLTNDLISYRFYNTSASTYIGRRGWLAWQEAPKLTAGDEYAIALVDAISSSQTIDLRIVTQAGTITLDPTSSTYAYSHYAGHSRVEIWKWS